MTGNIVVIMIVFIMCVFLVFIGMPIGMFVSMRTAIVAGTSP